ncbi:MAG: cupin domain-containing protein [Candidatus Latescibacteria bacterium]|nr:cupin domain-containing protein [Candidatus Latescibacterota bacterium]NIM21652.1 cupin domain-containing protein [Candidatus Latescibacterota bacterium]NIM64631.1 cupin domain-containing protein [Candidatus Latescibacterota bacterium]NIO01146.1 cupin domain-containing protein [Candidatus Latescibacterota bacterium]NIO27539.1 cupin domain-containing protein [Candidatus Latescibacterota bacterium]
MLDKAELGKRIKKVRESKHLTLKNIEAAAGISATHISEIERGKTSPTLGALMKISKALGKDPAHFIEEVELNDVSLVTLEDRIVEKLGSAGTMENLTTSIPGGKLQARFIRLSPGKTLDEHPHTHYGNEAALVLSGKILFTVDGEKYETSQGDAVYYNGLEEHSYENISKKDDATMLWVSTERGVS